MKIWFVVMASALAGTSFLPTGAGEPQPTFIPDYSGEFDSAPVEHWVVDLPGGKVNSATHTERAQPVIVGDSIFVGSAAGQGLHEVSRKDGRLIRTFSATSSVESALKVISLR